MLLFVVHGVVRTTIGSGAGGHGDTSNEYTEK